MSNETLDGAIPAGSGARGGPSQAQYRASGQEVGSVEDAATAASGQPAILALARVLPALALNEGNSNPATSLATGFFYRTTTA